MGLLVVIALLILIGMISAIFNRKCQNNMGYNIGKKHMRDEWGIDEQKLYRE